MAKLMRSICQEKLFLGDKTGINLLMLIPAHSENPYDICYYSLQALDSCQKGVCVRGIVIISFRSEIHKA
jgi:hypothetical protein